VGVQMIRGVGYRLDIRLRIILRGRPWGRSRIWGRLCSSLWSGLGDGLYWNYGRKLQHTKWGFR